VGQCIRCAARGKGAPGFARIRYLVKGTNASGA
jgi:hypothetical protein